MNRLRLKPANWIGLFTRPLLAAAVLLALSSVMLSSAQPRTCLVPSADFSTIDSALDDSTCQTIRIAAGVYNESLFITRNVTLVGAGQAATVIDPQRNNVAIKAIDVAVHVSHLTIQNGSGGRPPASSEGPHRSGITGGIENAAAATRGFGRVVVEHVTLRNNEGDLSGAVFNAGEMILSDVIITENTSRGANGGGIFNLGNMTLTNVTISKNSARIGGGIHVGGDRQNHATLTMTNVVISDNVADLGGGINISPQSTVSFDNVTVRNNSAGQGGGILNDNAMTTLAGSTIRNNRASKQGAGLYNANGRSIELNGVMVQNNSAPEGGGAFNAGTMIGQDTTFQANEAFSGGGVFNQGDLTLQGVTFHDQQAEVGGGVFNDGGTVELFNSTFSQNVAETAGGGIFNEATGQVELLFVTLHENPAGFGGSFFNNEGTFTVKNSLLSNTRSGGNCSLGIRSLGHNLSSDTSCIGSLVEGSDLNNVDPLLDPAGLKANGGPTLTVALLAGSPAIDAVPESACTDGEGDPIRSDQRGILRPIGSGCDIGAYEAQGGGGNEG